MTKFINTIPNQDKEKILDLYYGRGNEKLREALNRWQIAKKMNNKYSPAQIFSVILEDIDKGGNDE